MAIREDVVLVADGGDITVGRRTATFVYGRFDVALPEGMDQVETDPRLQDGFIYRPSEDIAPFDIGFIRQDVTVDLDVQQSDLELAVDTAQGVAGGDVFFERDIGPAGLGDFIPGKHFENGDLVNVELWSKRMLLPATADDWVADGTRGPHGNRVHVGGQLVSDPEGLQRHNAERQREVNADKRDLERRARDAKRHSENTRAGLTGSPDGDISDAFDSPATPIGAVNDRANTALEETKKVRDTLAGDGANDGDLVAQLASVNAELIRLGVEQQPSLLLAFVGLSTKLWKLQHALNEEQSKFNLLVSESQEESERSIDALREAQDSITDMVEVIRRETAREQTGTLITHASDFANGGSRDSRISLRASLVRIVLKPVGDWVGRIILQVSFETGGSHWIDIQVPVEGGEFEWQKPSGWNNITSVRADYTVFPGTVKRRSINTAEMPIGRGEWVQATTFTIPSDASGVSVAFRADWGAASHDHYAIRLLADGVEIGRKSVSALGPLTPLGNGNRHIMLRTLAERGGTFVSEVFSGAQQASQRRLSGSTIDLIWTEQQKPE
ncbi:hypothetical protein [Corynebacterium cystitidis]|uniref:hypothetical protein n=1 Tax=Corynebacterium cystitidis TaxID=35757 RepID=UPI00211EDE81|nr:hypothetical protein [Corynebacterium cystitidis]